MKARRPYNGERMISAGKVRIKSKSLFPRFLYRVASKIGKIDFEHD
jgi:hypothetical protein